MKPDEHQSQVLLSLGRMEGRMEQFLTHQARHEDRLNEHDTRLGKLETTQAARKGYTTGAVAAASLAASVGTWLATHVGSLFR